MLKGAVIVLLPLFILSTACRLTTPVPEPVDLSTPGVNPAHPTAKPTREPFIPTIAQTMLVIVETPLYITPATPVPSLTALPAPTLVDAQAAIPQATIEHYYITGETAAELRQAMDNNSLSVSPDGFKGDAITDWYFSWNWPGYGKLNCNLSKAVTSYTITVTLPYWDAPASANPDLVAQWTRYYNILVLHEGGHVERAMEYYKRLLPAIKTATCETADKAAHTVMDALDAESQEYDDATGHGTTQGAIFP